MRFIMQMGSNLSRMLQAGILAFVLCTVFFTSPLQAQEVSMPDPVTLDDPEFVNFKGPDGKRLRGELVYYDFNSFKININRKASDQREFNWTKLEPKDVFVIHARLFDKDTSAERWYQLGALLFQFKDGGEWSLKSLQNAKRALKDDEADLREKITMAIEKAEAKKTGEDQGVWGVMTDDQSKEAVQKLKEYAVEAKKVTKRDMTLHETRFFLLYTDLDPKEAKEWASLLDKMYAYMCKQFNIRRSVNIWWGKCLVFIYKERQDYYNHVIGVMGASPQFAKSSAGVCQQSPMGMVHLAMYRQPEKRVFAHILVHETGHGFVHRYRSPRPLTNWANEGLVEVVAENMTKSGILPKNRIPQARATLKQTRSFGGDFFTVRNIAGWQYGVAADFTEFLIKLNRRKYIEFINLVKDGMDSRDALKEAFGHSHTKLIEAYGKKIGVDGLGP